MKRTSYLAASLVLTLMGPTSCFFFNQSSDENDGGTGPNGGGGVTFRVAVYSGSAPVSDAEIYIDGSSAPVARTVSGIADFTAKVGTEVGVRVSKAGFVDNVQKIRRDNGVTRLVVNAWLVQVGSTTKIDPALGGRISTGGAQVVIPPNALQAPGGTANVDVAVTYLTGANLAQVGTFNIQNPQGDETILLSLGVVVLAAWDVSGNEVRINAAVGVEISIPANIPAGQTVTVMPPLWRQDPNTGDWIRQTSTWTLNTTTNMWVAQVDALATWNCDYPSRVTCVTGRVVGEDGSPFGGVAVKGVMTGQAASFLPATTVQRATTGSNGNFCMEVVPGSQLTATVTVPGGGDTTVFHGAVTAAPGLRCGSPSCQEILDDTTVGCFTDEDCDSSAKEKCRLGECVPPAACSGATNAGGDIPDERTFEMTQSSGTFDFFYQTYSIKDQVIVTQGGAILFDSGCVGSSDTVPLTLNGTSSEIVVRVVPNCACTNPAGCTGTEWNYRVGCPTQ